MIKVKTSDLIGMQLDWAVAVAAQGNPYQTDIFAPSSDWMFGGPIIERERIALVNSGGEWDAYVRGGYTHDEGVTGAAESSGPTPLIAAMRAYVASKLGDEVEVPA